MNMLTRKLIAKEFYLHRWLMVGSTVAGLAGLAIAAEGEMRFNIGMLTWLTAIIAFGVVLAMLGIANERKERALQFVLSLPLSPGDYVRIKLFGLFLCYLVPWAILSAGAVVLLLVRPNLPDGLLPFALLLSGFMLANFSVVLCGALHTASEGVMTLVIIVTNMNVTLFIFLVGGVPALNDHLHAATPVWNDAFWIVLAAEAATLSIALLLPYFVAARRRDFV
jgi:ABC-type transport system involved in multi-copper enzyme maturation permease subunit